MILEKIEDLNKRLAEIYGIDTESTDPIFRIVWSENQFEHRLTEFSDGGIRLLKPEVRYLPKYRQWVSNKYVLERLVLVPDINASELPVVKKSYEPLWVFRDDQDNAVPPVWMACQFIVDTLYAALGKSSMAKYVDEELTNPDIKRKRIEAIEQELYADESKVGDHLHQGTGVFIPSSSKEIH